MGVHSIFHILHHHEPKHPTELSNHNSMSSSHVKSFSDKRIDLLEDMAVTFATSHLLRFRLKAEDERNTVARKDGRVHSKTTQEEKPEEEP
jgi:hypothetical protein